MNDYYCKSFLFLVLICINAHFSSGFVFKTIKNKAVSGYFSQTKVFKFNKNQELTLGPIIGKVTENQARIMVEFKYSGFIIMELITEEFVDVEEDTYQEQNRGKILPEEKMLRKIRREKKKTIKSQSQYVIANRPKVFFFTGLKTNTIYNIKLVNHVFQPKIKMTKIAQEANFKTLKFEYSNEDRLNFAFVGSNDINYSLQSPPNQNLWFDIANKVTKNKLDYIIHTGNQIYVDHGKEENKKSGIYYQVKTLMSPIGRSDFHKFKLNVREIIRSEYRKTWSYPPTALAMSRVPNIMMFDDHDFLNTEEFSTADDGDSFDFFFLQQARYVNYEYQRSLREDVNLTEKKGTIKSEFFSETFKAFSIVFIDFRGREWHTQSGTDSRVIQLGTAQTKWYKKLFSKGSKLDKSKTVIIATSQPIFLFSEHEIKNLKFSSSMADNNWNIKSKKELIVFLDYIRNWKNETKKDILFLGSQIHLGGHSNVYYKGEPFARQFVTSGINQINYRMYNEFYKRTNFYHCDNIGDYYFFHKDWVRMKNYGEMQFIYSSTGLKVNYGLIYARKQKVEKAKHLKGKKNTPPAKSVCTIEKHKVYLLSEVKPHKKMFKCYKKAVRERDFKTRGW